MEVDKVILVDEQDMVVGTAEKLQAHREGLLHRAFSIFLFNSKGEMLLQRRALEKYHSGGLWSNACCSHPAPGESTAGAAKRRLSEELGITTALEKAFDFVYRTSFENGLTEYEFDHVFTGICDGKIDPNKEEVMETCYKTMEEIKFNITEHPEQYTAWFVIAFSRIEKWFDDTFGV